MREVSFHGQRQYATLAQTGEVLPPLVVTVKSLVNVVLPQLQMASQVGDVLQLEVERTVLLYYSVSTLLSVTCWCRLCFLCSTEVFNSKRQIIFLSCFRLAMSYTYDVCQFCKSRKYKYKAEKIHN